MRILQASAIALAIIKNINIRRQHTLKLADVIKDVNMLGEGMFLPYQAVAKSKIIMLTLNSRTVNKLITSKGV